ncbi:MAG: antitoxin Xre-like helix-turn-helix domain-containing protein [Trueperaceae bacterium]
MLGILPQTLNSFTGLADNRTSLIEAVREGLPYALFEDLIQALELSHRELAGIIGLPLRTLNNRKHAGRFTPQESDHLLRVARVYGRVVEFFGHRDRARDWLKRPAFAFDEKPPLSLLDTELGAEAVSTLIGQLEHGVLP